MNVHTRKSLPWILGGVGVLAVVTGLMIGLALSGNPNQATAQIPHNALTESVPVTNPVDASLAPAGPEFATVVESEGGSPAVSGQARIPANIKIEPEEDWNPVKTQHTFTVTVTDAGNSPVPGAEVELILNRFSGAVGADGKTIFSVGDIVSIDNGEKVDNTFGTVTTNAAGQAKFTITATREGDTDVTAYAPGILDDDKHKVFAVKHWIDKDVVCPEPAVATNQAGQPHGMMITVYRASEGFDFNNEPAVGEQGETVRWSIESGPAGTFSESSTTEFIDTTDGDGRSTATLIQDSASTGENTITVAVLDDSDREMFNCTVVKKWIAGQLGISKEASAETVNIGETVTFTINVQNLNDAGSLTNVRVTDMFPNGGFETNDSTEWELASLGAGASEPFTITATAIATGTYTNEVTARSTEDPGPVSDTATVTVVAPDVTVTKMVEPTQILVDQTATYTITVTNNSTTATANNVVITDEPDGGLKRVSSNLDSSIAQLAPSASQTYTMTVMGTERGQFTNVVSLDWDERDASGLPEPSASAILTVLEPDIEILKSGRSVLFTGQQGTYTLDITNTGDADLTDVVITDTFPTGMSYVSSDNNGTVSGNVVTWAIGNLQVDESRSVSLTLRGNVASNNYTNQASVTSTEGATDNAAMAIRVLPAAGASLTIEDDFDPVEVGDTVNYTITVENQSPDTPMTQVSVAVEVPTELDIVSVSSNGIQSGGTVTFPTVATLAGGDSVTFTIQVTAASAGDTVVSAELNYAEFTRSITAQQGTTIIAP